MTLTEFLLTRIAEDEVVARAATTRPIVTTYLASNVRREVSPDRINIIWQTDEGRDYPSDRGTFSQGEDHFNRFRPTRVLTECEAKRQIVDLCGDQPPGWVDAGLLGDRTLRYLALPYADHEDYRQEWRP